MKISPMIKTVTCITYSALILLSIIILWCVFSSTVESFGDKCYSSGGSTCPSPKTPETPDTPTTPTTPKCSEDGGDSPDEDSPDSDEILCPAAENDVAKTSEYVGHNGRMCEYLKDKGEKKCNERHVVDSNTGEKIWCKWDNGECIKGGSCGAGDDGNTEGGGTCGAGAWPTGPIPRVSMDFLRDEGEHNLETIARLDYINGEYCGKCKEATSKDDCVTSYQVCGKNANNMPLAQPCKWTDAAGVSEMGI